MNITITKNLIKKISIMEHILSSIGKSAGYINGILVKRNGMMQAAGPMNNMSFKLSAEELGLTAELEANLILPEMAYKFLKNLTPGTSVEIVLDKNNILKLVVDGKKKKKNRVEFVTQAPTDYPSIAKTDTNSMQKLNSAWFKKAIMKCSYAISTNPQKQIYTAAHLVARDGKIVMYAIDGFNAAVVSNSVDEAIGDFVLSIPQEMIKILSNVEFAETVIVGFNSDHSKAVFVTDESTVFQTSLLTGKPLMYSEFIGKGKYSFTLSTQPFINTIKQICLLNAAKAEPMSLTVKGNELLCSFHNTSSQFEDTVEVADNSLSEGEEVIIGVNPNALLNTLKSCTDDADKISVKFSGPLTPLEIYNGDFSAIVVPIRLSR